VLNVAHQCGLVGGGNHFNRVDPYLRIGVGQTIADNSKGFGPDWIHTAEAVVGHGRNGRLIASEDKHNQAGKYKSTGSSGGHWLVLS